MSSAPIAKQTCRLIVQLEVRIYSVIFLSMLVAFVMDTYFEHRGLQEPRTASSDALRHVYDVFVEVLHYLKSLRKDSPSAVSDRYKTHRVCICQYA